MVPVAVYAFLGKVLPDVVTHAHLYARLSAPVGYWNVLAIMLVMAIVPALEGASRRGLPAAARGACAGALVLFFFALFFSFSRGGTWPWCSPWWSTSRSPTNVCRACSAWRWPRRRSPWPSTARATSTRSSTPPRTTRYAEPRDTRSDAAALVALVVAVVAPGGRGARHTSHRARRPQARPSWAPGAGRGRRHRGGRRTGLRRADGGVSGVAHKIAHQFTSSDSERQSRRAAPAVCSPWATTGASPWSARA